MAFQSSYEGNLVDAIVGIGSEQFSDISIKEIILGESLTTPGLQTAITLQSFVYSELRKDFSNYKDKVLEINMRTKDGSNNMYVNQKIYRIDNRALDINVGQTETFTIHACDQSLLNDAQSLVSKSWKCTRPSEIVNYVLTSCAGVNNPVVDSCEPARDYIADNIHPFQVIQQQCNVALDGDDPSFLHYMTFEESGKHYFRSLKKLISQPTNQAAPFFHSETNMDLANPYKAINFNFPCDFDYLSDLLNGIDATGKNINSLATINPVTGLMQGFGGMSGGCGIGSGNHKTAITNSGSAQQQNSCEMKVEQYLLKRQARMGLLEKDKVALRITVPWNPNMHVGRTIDFKWDNKYTNSLVYGSNTYLVSSLKHNIQFGGFATTTLDCISLSIS